MSKRIYILIDDDFLIRKSWEFASKKANVELYTFEDISSFLAQNFSSKDIQIYIDQELKNGLLGINEAKKIFDEGFHNIYLATGHTPESISKPDYILGIIGKTPPFLI